MSPRSTTLMPSSGSTTSFSASRTSSDPASVDSPDTSISGRSVVWVSSVMSSPRCLSAGYRLGSRVLERHPSEQGALDPRRELRDTRERDAVLEHVFVRLDLSPALHQLHEAL